VHVTAHLRRNPLRVTRKQTAHANVRQAQPELHNALQTEATSSMGRASVAEAVDIVLCAGAVRVNRWVVLAHLLGQQLRVVDTLGAGTDFLAAHEEVVGVGELGVVWRGHCVCGTDGERELVEDVEVGAVLLEDKTAEVLFLRCAVDCQRFRMKRANVQTYLKSS
jgi:hypothetical protein